MKRKLFVLAAIVLLLTVNSICYAKGLEDNYNAALELMTKGKYREAADAFESLFGYEDSNLYAVYAKGLAEGEEGSYVEAIKAFDLLGEFRDSAYQSKYYQAREYESTDSFWAWDQAISIYNDMRMFRDANDRIVRLEGEKSDRYEQAVEMGMEGNFSDAADAFISMNDYQDSDNYATYYRTRAEVAENPDQIDCLLDTIGKFRFLYDFLDSSEQAAEITQRLWSHLSVGDQLHFGMRSIPWTILALDDSEKRVLLLCNETYEIIGFQNYHFRSWDESNMREWLNGEFLERYFGEGDRYLIEHSEITNAHTEKLDGTNIWMDEDTTYDDVFLLSLDELEDYLPETTDRRIDNTRWVLRNKHVAFQLGPIYYYTVEEDGSIGYTDITDKRASMNLRPALWINL